MWFRRGSDHLLVMSLASCDFTTLSYIRDFCLYCIVLFMDKLSTKGVAKCKLASVDLRSNLA